jgi:16S rRNA (cytosine967-C5)-methyltransferase
MVPRRREARTLGLSAGRRPKQVPKRTGPADVPGLAVRRTAASILRMVVERRVPLDALIDEGHGNEHFRALEPRDRALARSILGAALRRRGEIAAALAHCLDRPLPQGSDTLSAILHVGAAQILYLDVPDHAAVDLAVTQTRDDRGSRNASGLVNSVLRRLARERAEITGDPRRARLNAPDWLFESWVAAYGEETAQAIVAAHLVQPGLDLSPKRDALDWAARLGATPLPTGSIRLASSQRVSALEGYDEGAWWVQDAAAALPARLLGDVSGRSVADLCAAPGGKTAQLAAIGAAVTAVDLSESRLKRLAGNLARLGLEAELQATDLLTWEPGRSFDAVLLDAPCSATGTIRRHPDIAWLKRPEDVVSLASLQARMLERAAALVRPGGTLVFCTCSLQPEEGEAQVAPFLAGHADFTVDPVDPAEMAGLAHLVTPDGTLRTLPSHAFGPEPELAGMDGFFAARFRRG